MSPSISKRAVAVALAASVAFSGAQTVAPNDIAPVAVAQEVTSATSFVENADGSVTITDADGNEILVVSKEEYDKLVQRVDELEKQEDVFVTEGVRNDDNSITLTLNNGDEITIPPAAKIGLEKCLNAPGGALLALTPIIGLLTAGLAQFNLDAINNALIDAQKRAGIYNEQAAKFVADNRGPLGALVGTLLGSIFLFIPGLCGESSVADAIGESIEKSKTRNTEAEEAARQAAAQNN